ncbi:MAG TPA: flagellar basal body rod protein FlgB [Stellaceae bacterium]|nr:flagellar basal body rod protein FlgB [Stellaceae bacterium]
MVGPVDMGLDFYRQVLNLRAYRQQILSADIANASTPGFKAVDLDFKSALAAAVAAPSGGTAPSARPLWLVDSPAHMTPASASSAPASAAAFVKYQLGSEVTLDGNSVDLNQEKVKAAENAVDYEAAATFATQTIKLLMTAVTGSQSSSSSGG